MKNRILVVEDSTLQARMITDLLTEHEIESDIAISGAMALEKASTGKFDLILMDMVLPDTSGLNLIAQLKNNSTTAEIPIIMLTGVTDKENVVQALSKGVADYITKPYHAQELIVRLNLQLTLLRNMHELKTNHETKSKIFSVLAHDIKSPFNTLLGFTDLIADGNVEEDKIKEYMKIINQSAKNIYIVLENVLIWTGMQSGMMKPVMGKLSLSKLTDELLQLCQPIAQEKKQSLTANIDIRLTVKADIHMINSVLRNLIINAIKFTPEGGNIIVAGSNDANDIRITISDNGVGIPKEDAVRIFNFDNNRRLGTNGERGTGLGLPLCKEFMEAMEGEISVESTLGHGSVFTLKLPL